MSICDLCQLSSPSGCTKLNNEVCLKEAFKLIRATATNGDVIEALFSDTELHLESDYAFLIFQIGVNLEDRDGRWWNAPYKVGDADG